MGYLDNNNDGTYSVLYKKKKDIPEGELMKNTFLIRSEKYDNINFNGRVRDANFPGHFYWTKKNTGKQIKPPISIDGQDANKYDWNSGQSVVYLFPYKGKTRYVHFAGFWFSISFYFFPFFFCFDGVICKTKQPNF